MRMVLLISILCGWLSPAMAAAEFDLGFLPGLSTKAALPLGLLRLDANFLVGSDDFKIGPCFGGEAVVPEQTDIFYGAGLRIGRDVYVELDGGYLHRTLTQTGTADLQGDGVAGNLALGWYPSAHAGVALTVTAKSLTSGSLESRLSFDLLPILMTRMVF